jgi:hypothetical protein
MISEGAKVCAYTHGGAVVPRGGRDFKGSGRPTALMPPSSTLALSAVGVRLPNSSVAQRGPCRRVIRSAGAIAVAVSPVRPDTDADRGRFGGTVAAVVLEPNTSSAAPSVSQLHALRHPLAGVQAEAVAEHRSDGRGRTYRSDGEIDSIISTDRAEGVVLVLRDCDAGRCGHGGF